MLEYVQSHPTATAIYAILLTFVVKFFITGYKIRSRMHKLPGPPGHSMIWGHLKMMGEIQKEIPDRLHPHAASLRIKEKYGIKDGYFYVDAWPFSVPLLYIVDPKIAQQCTVENSMPKHHTLLKFLRPIAGPGDLVSSNGAHWKKWRSIMNPGFAASHLMTLAPGIVDDSLVFVEKMGEKADSGHVFRLEEDATRLTVDIIGKVALDLQLGTQRGENEMITAFRDQVQLLPNEGPLDPFSYHYPWKYWMRWRNEKIMTNYIGRILDERFTTGTTATESRPGKKQRRRAIVDLAMDSYLTELEGGDAENAVQHKAPVMDDEFRTAATTQIRTFVFAGHDTTSSTICYALYMLQRHPEAMARLRKEHDTILGSIEGTADVIKNDPHILNKLEYTNSVIKETLRLWPAASSTRIGEPGATFRDPRTGESYPTDGFLVWLVSWSMHRDKAIWGETAEDFEPSRFMSENESKLPENAWRPFEKGPRNCIGQELAMLEARIILALVVRSFEFDLAFDSLDELANDGSYYATNPAWRRGKQDLDGEPLYPILLGTAKPREGMPVRVRRVAQR